MVRKYFKRQNHGIHVLAAVIYSFLEQGMKKDNQTYSEFISMLFEEGKLKAGKIKEDYKKFMGE